MDDNGNVLTTLDPHSVKRIHVVGVAGTGMGSFAGMLKAAGYEVTGSDENVYPPMSDMLKAWGITALTPYAPSNLDAAKPDLVIVGNVIRRVNPEATAVRERALAQMSFPAALGCFFLKTRHSVVIAGTHGKTTTSALMGHVLAAAGRDPTFLVGGVTQNYGGNYRVGNGPHFVVEGDEYDTAYFDKGPKFLHYRPTTVILTSMEFDHADIYADLQHYEASFRKARRARARRRNPCRLRELPERRAPGEGLQGPRHHLLIGAGPRALLLGRGRSLPGRRLAVAAAAGRPPQRRERARRLRRGPLARAFPRRSSCAGFASFQGVKRRQEERGTVRGVLVIDDFAHHPTAVRETLAAVKGRYAGRRLVAVFEPRSNTSRRNLHQAEYAASFGSADLAFIKTPEKHDKIPEGEGLDATRLAKELPIPAEAIASVDALVEAVASKTRDGDVVLVMSNGGFGGFIDKLLQRLKVTT